MATGRTPGQKRALLEAITDAVEQHLEAPRDSVRVWITEFADTDYMAGGELLRDRRARLSGEITS
jgi:4-oxalocrotonate tautomerase